MNSDVVIRIEGLGKRYTLGAAQKHERYTALRDVLAAKVKSLIRQPFPRSSIRSRTSETDFWALKDVSFEVRRGEVVGIIGRNGAGKSTLLKILSRITEPTEGRIGLRGRMASLLEVGTGFHPELTGRENIFLNGAILGLHRREIKAKFDEIVDFAEVEQFLDTPVKRYSSGMYVRLAFAVAAHMEPEILVIDEVLAVGDAAFQKKCLGKMQNVAKGEGRTVLFVSHNMGAVRRLCDRGTVLTRGQSSGLLDIETAISQYQSAATGAQFNEADVTKFRFIKGVRQENASGKETSNIFFGELLRLQIKLRDLPQCSCAVNIIFLNEFGEVFSLFSTNPHDGVYLPAREEVNLTFTMDEVRFVPGVYSIEVALTEPGVQVMETTGACVQFELSPQPLHGTLPYDRRYGQFFPNHSWLVDDVLHER